MRVGFWRFLAVLNRLKLKAPLGLNGWVIKSYPPVAKAALDAGWEFMGHGLVQRPMHHVKDQRKEIHETIRAIRAFTGKAPRGWESPGLTETFETIDLLAAEGIEYIDDCALDDQPVRIQTASGPIVSVPYTVEMNDIAMMQIQHHPSHEWLRRGTDTFDRLWLDGEKTPRIMRISVHPSIHRPPPRLAYLEKLYEYILSREGVLMWTGAEILDWYLKHK